MSINPSQLDAQLKRGLAPAYLLAGEEPLLLLEAADAIRARARGAGYDEREVLHAEPGFDWLRLRAAGENLSLFSARRIIELHLPERGPGQEGAQALLDYFAAPPPDTLLLVHAGRLDKRSRSAAWVEAFERTGVVVYAWPMDAAEVTRWIERRLKAAGLQPDAAALELLASRTEGNLLACAQDIDKLRLLCPQGSLSREQVLAAVADSARFDINDLGDRALAGDAAAALQTLGRLREEGEAAPLLLWALARDLRSLYAMTEALAGGMPAERAQALAGVWQNRRAPFAAAARRLKPAAVLDLIRQAAWVDRVAKGAVRGEAHSEVWEELVKLTARLAGLPLAAPPRNRQVV